MAQQCFQNEYFDNLLNACTPCHLRCSNTPPLTCQRHCNAMKITNAILWTCLGLSLTVSLTIFVKLLLKKMKSAPLKKDFKNIGPALREAEAAELESGRTGTAVLSSGLEYTVEDCTCEDCVKSKVKAESDHIFPFPVMEEGATILVTTKTNDYCNSLPGAVCHGDGEINFY
ncbi:tumor necrosis factor receptor superfamily member 17 [Talpa occidentalis]|uniref:tumor necrosis factor receptor superfamily member 17 n=1 Tax=Talpa occidentalis TaxID=50954 RepID=UPI00189011B9|nr:tumor necrosis factor receptor superfamily member 17 [Talpa occidentalis]XP_037363480.1 tumor necrosis factor receptor superfamily member 17 [Talpa occidentalis]XP_054549813.1 tumor necrosis factor receptor superfamily member 17 [Talpa occidentalis]XP_054549814.1 tumor necrosis factor receptor superfamily member 17 [Talpa occidentalis]